MTNIEAKANIINKYFVQMCSETLKSSTFPPFISRSQIGLEGFTIRREGVLQLIRFLDRKKAHGSDEISIAMIKICDISIVETFGYGPMPVEKGKYSSYSQERE